MSVVEGAGWLTHVIESGEVHVLPLEDGVDHHMAGTCLCGPRLDVIARDDGTYGYIHVHHSLDGREVK